MDCPQQEGKMVVFSKNPWKKLVAFLTGRGTRCIVIIGGQADGFFGLNYTQQLIEGLGDKGWAVVQALFSSWYAGYGEATLENDNEDLDLLMRHLVAEEGMTEIALLGHHTGAQDVLYYMQNGDYRDKVTHVIFQGGMRDPKAHHENDPEVQQRYRDTAQTMIDQGRGNQLLPPSVHPIPISAFRFLALGGMQGVQDFFNPIQTEEAMAQVIGHLSIPTLILFCCSDEYRPMHQVKLELLDKIQTCIDADVRSHWIPGACDEHLNFLKGFESTLTGYVMKFLEDEERKRKEKEEEERREKEQKEKEGRSIVFKSGKNLRRSVTQGSISSGGADA